MINYFLTILSPIILSLAFPKANLYPLAWIGLVPFLFALDGQSYKRCFGLGYLAGLVYYTIMIYWLMHVTFIGASLLIAYLALYFSFFALAYCFSRRFPIVLGVFFLSAFWILLEYARGYVFTGFGWAAFGQSQTKFLPIIQIADLFGMHSVTFLIVFFNLSFKELIVSLKNKDRIRQSSVAIVLVFIMVIGSFIYGKVKIESLGYDNYLNVGVVQGNVAQTDKWRRDLWPEIMERHNTVTDNLLSGRNLDLVVWPETSYPGILWDDIGLYQDLISETRDRDTPLLFGSAMWRNQKYFNSALLLDRSGELTQIYDKLHLVPFGEYVPLRNILPFLADIVPIGDFSAGEDYTIFRLPGTQVKFSSLICFEDTVSHLARGFVKGGAQFLVNITNDAWFMDTKAPFLHLSASVFRAVENRRSLVRAANTGVSAFIAPSGEVIATAEQNGDQTFVAAFESDRVPLNEKITFFTHNPHFFGYFCFAIGICGLIYGIRNRNTNKQY